jgi:hypothetical protein
MQRTQLITEEDRERINSFVEDMDDIACNLPTWKDTNYPKDDEGVGAYLEQDLFTGVTLVMDWSYLDAPSTALLIDTDAPGYDGPGPFLPAAGEVYDELDAELQAVLRCGPIEYGEGNSDSNSHVWHIHGATPW